mgnify:FL=1|jgi:NADH-quinone oxidoreductase subunit A
MEMVAPDSLMPLILFALAAASVGIGMLLLGSWLGPRRQGAVKQMPYESGMDPIHSARRRFDIRFHLIAIVFLLFDVELLFLYPWAVTRNHDAGLGGPPIDGVNRLLIFSEVMVFLAMLTLGLVYVWRKGVFRWR